MSRHRFLKSCVAPLAAVASLHACGPAELVEPSAAGQAGGASAVEAAPAIVDELALGGFVVSLRVPQSTSAAPADAAISLRARPGATVRGATALGAFEVAGTVPNGATVRIVAVDSDVPLDRLDLWTWDATQQRWVSARDLSRATAAIEMPVDAAGSWAIGVEASEATAIAGGATTDVRLAAPSELTVVGTSAGDTDPAGEARPVGEVGAVDSLGDKAIVFPAFALRAPLLEPLGVGEAVCMSYSLDGAPFVRVQLPQLTNKYLRNDIAVEEGTPVRVRYFVGAASDCAEEVRAIFASDTRDGAVRIADTPATACETDTEDICGSYYLAGTIVAKRTFSNSGTLPCPGSPEFPTDANSDGVPDSCQGTLPLGDPCSADDACASGACATGADGTDNDRCVPRLFDGDAAQMDFAYVPPTGPGGFTMGSPAGEVGYRDADETEHNVVISRAMVVALTEVTQRQWVAAAGANPSCFQSAADTACGGADENGDGPVERVDWWSAAAYTNWLSDNDGDPATERCYAFTPADWDLTVSNWAGGASEGVIRTPTATTFAGPGCTGYRLATDAEWEWAARAGASTTTQLGALAEPFQCEFQPNLDPIAWYCGNSGGRSRSVGEKLPNAFGLYDTLGNVWEWTTDWYIAAHPSGVDPVVGAGSGYRVGRGAQWGNRAGALRLGNRSRGAPAQRINNTGLRVFRALPSED